MTVYVSNVIILIHYLFVEQVYDSLLIVLQTLL